MDKKTLDEILKKASIENKFSIEADFIIFDKNSNLSFRPIPDFTLAELLTKNPISSYTKLSKKLLLWLHTIRTVYGKPININSGFRSPEYNFTIPGSAKDSWHTKGLAFDLGVPDPVALKQVVEKLSFNGELGLYDHFIHIAPVSENVRWDNRKKKSLLNYIDSDQKRNYTVYALLGLIGLFILSLLGRKK